MGLGAVAIIVGRCGETVTGGAFTVLVVAAKGLVGGGIIVVMEGVGADDYSKMATKLCKITEQLDEEKQQLSAIKEVKRNFTGSLKLMEGALNAIQGLQHEWSILTQIIDKVVNDIKRIKDTSVNINYLCLGLQPPILKCCEQHICCHFGNQHKRLC